MTKEDIKEAVKTIGNKLQIRKNYFVTIINRKTGVSCTSWYKLNKREREIRIDEINNDPELKVVNFFNNGVVAMI